MFFLRYILLQLMLIPSFKPLSLNSPRSPMVINWLLIFFPLFFILGNSAMNLFTVLFCIFSFSYFFKNEVKFSLKNLEIIFLIFCLLLVASSVLENGKVVKSISYLRFFILFYFCNYFFRKKLIDIKKLFNVYSTIVLVVSVDLIIQHFTGYNIVGLKINNMGATSFFIDERVAGSFIKNFGFFLVFLIFTRFKNIKFIKIIYIPILLSIINISIFVTTQRMPMIIWITFLLIYGSIYYKTKLKSIIISFLILFLFIINPSSDKISSRYLSFRDDVIQLTSKMTEVQEIFTDKKKLKEFREQKGGYGSYRSTLNSGAGHANLYANSIVIWKSHKLIGIGIKNFYNKCTELKMYMCSLHPHNYYLEVLVTTGLIGTLFFLIFLCLIFFKSIKLIKINYLNQNYDKLNFLLIYFVMFLMNFFPLQSTGSIFSTSSATYIFIMLSLLVSNLTENNLSSKS